MLPANARAVFISYAHADNESRNPKERWLDRFVEFLKPLVRQENFTLCSDQDIKIGENWHEHIQAHLNGAKAVVLLVSPAFLASDYTANSELPVILKNAAEHGVKIFPILISPSAFKKVKFKYPDPKTGPQEFTLSSLQTANPPSETLIEMTEGEQNRVLEKVADQLADLLSANPQ
jgi:TIR domain